MAGKCCGGSAGSLSNRVRACVTGVLVDRTVRVDALGRMMDGADKAAALLSFDNRS
jgi:hypothetical protein